MCLSDSIVSPSSGRPWSESLFRRRKNARLSSSLIPSLLIEFVQGNGGPDRGAFRRGCRRDRRAGGLRDQLVDRDVPGDVSDRDDGGLLARVELDDPAGAIVSEARDHNPIAGLEACPRFGDGVSVTGLVLELGQASGEGLAGPFGFGLGLEGR